MNRIIRCLLITGLAVSFTLVTVCSTQAQDKVSGIDQSLISESVAAGDNFYAYANEKWLKETEIPGDKSNYGIFTVLNDVTQEQVKALIESAAKSNAESGTAAQKVGDLYNSVLDMEKRNAAGIDPIRPALKVVSNIKDTKGISKALGQLSKFGVYGPCVAYVSVDAKNSDQYTVYVTQSGLTLPDRDYYLKDDERNAELQKQLVDYIEQMLTLVDHADPAAAAKNIMAIEKKIAAAQWSKTQNRDPEDTYNRMTTAEVNKLLGPVKWRLAAGAMGLSDQSEFVVRQPPYFAALGKMFKDTPVEHWRDYLTFHVVDAYASDLSEDIERKHFAFHKTAISGISEQEPLWKRGVNTTGSVTGELVGQLYVEQHFKAVAKERMNELVGNLKRAFEKRIDTRDWMSKGTKKQAKEKLSMFNTKIGYPDEWKDYSKLKITDAPLAENLIAYAAFEHQRELDKLGGPIDRNEWHMTPHTINAYYSPTMNEIVFPAAILQPPFFNLQADDAVNYGGIGAVIGHELSHGFDDKGSKYDGKGNLRSWWTEQDRAEFERRGAALVEQYDSFEPVPGNNVNGKLTLGENIGDLGGLNVAYEAYRLSLAGKEAPVIDGLTGDQRFFLGWAQVWRRLYRESELLKRLIVDPHSPSGIA